MAEHKTFDVGFGDVHLFEWTCGHKLNQTQTCPICDQDSIKNMMIARFEAMGKKIELRDQLLTACQEAFSNLIEFDTISPEVKHELYGIMLKIDSLRKGLVNGKES
jgi:hypothetical protein